MDQITKDALIKDEKLLNPEALERRKEINKKIYKFFGCGLLLLLLTVIILAIYSHDNEKKQKDNAIQTDKPAKESAKKTEPFLQTRQNIQRVIGSLDKNYGIKAKNEYQKEYCLNDTFCEIYADTIKIRAIGYRIEPTVNSKTNPSFYQAVCSAVLIALSGGANKELAEQTTIQYFNYAAQNGKARATVLGVDMRVKPTSSGLLECSFIKIG